MATVYILYFKSVDKFYVGSTADLEFRLVDYNSGNYATAFTKRATEWKIYFTIKDLNVQQS